MAENSFTDEAQPKSQGQFQQTPGQRYQFTPDELRCLKECNRESFYYRCIPIGTALGTATYYAIRYGYLKGSPRFGAVPKVVCAAAVGYFIGKFSYQQKYAERLMELPNSPLGEMLRKQKSARGKSGSFGGLTEVLTLEPGFTTTGLVHSIDESDTSSKNFSDVSDPRPLTDSFDFSEYGGSHHENELQMREDTLPPKPPQFYTSYDELRKHNRDDYERKIHNSSLQGINDNSISSTSRRSDSRNISPNSDRNNSQSQFPSPQNTYGDTVWDDKPL